MIIKFHNKNNLFKFENELSKSVKDVYEANEVSWIDPETGEERTGILEKRYMTVNLDERD